MDPARNRAARHRDRVSTVHDPVAAAYEFPRPIWVDHDVLGTRHLTHIGPITAVVVTPPGPPDYGPPQLAGVAGGVLGPALPGEPNLPLDAHPDDAATLAPSWTTYYAAEHRGTQLLCEPSDSS